tara:strand:+ start:898 stop:1107 length:210 start_codon:yes stop_codon:yes gene_type:complete
MMSDELYEKVNQYTKYKLVEMLIEKHKDTTLDNLNIIDQVADDVLGILGFCGMKYYQELNDDFNGDEQA